MDSVNLTSSQESEAVRLVHFMTGAAIDAHQRRLQVARELIFLRSVNAELLEALREACISEESRAAEIAYEAGLGAGEWESCVSRWWHPARAAIAKATQHTDPVGDLMFSDLCPGCGSDEPTAGCHLCGHKATGKDG